MKKKKLLAIVDDWERLERYEDLLHVLFEFHPAPFGGHGVEIAIAEKPDFVLVDLEFEDMTAEEVLERIRAQDGLQNTFFVVVSSAKTHLHTSEDESTHLLTRPVSVDSVLQFLKSKSS